VPIELRSFAKLWIKDTEISVPLKPGSRGTPILKLL